VKSDRSGYSALCSSALLCQRCGYDLRGLDAAGRCPECNAPISAALHGEQVEFADPQWLQRLAKGSRCVKTGGWSLALVCGTWLVPLKWLDVPSPLRIALGAVAVASVVFFLCLGIWYLGEPDPRTKDREPTLSHRRLFRSMFAAVPLTLVMSLVLLRTAGPAAFCVTQLLGAPIGLVGMVMIWAYGTYMQWLATRVGVSLAVTRARDYRNAYTFSWLLFAPAVFASWLTGGHPICLCGAFIAGIGMLAFGVLLLSLPTYIADGLQRASAAAIWNWSAPDDKAAEAERMRNVTAENSSGGDCH